jgi:hypothetical protein
MPQERSITLTQNSKLPALSSEQMDFLKRFVLLEARMEDIREVLDGVFDFDFRGRSRTASVRFRVPEPGVIVTRNNILHAVERRKLGKLSEQELIFWATMLLLNDAFELDPNDQEFVSEWLNEVSFNGYSEVAGRRSETSGGDAG